MKRRAPDDITVDTKAVLSGILQNMDMAGIVHTCMATDTGQQTQMRLDHGQSAIFRQLQLSALIF